MMNLTLWNDKFITYSLAIVFSHSPVTKIVEFFRSFYRKITEYYLKIGFQEMLLKEQNSVGFS